MQSASHALAAISFERQTTLASHGQNLVQAAIMKPRSRPIPRIASAHQTNAHAPTADLPKVKIVPLMATRNACRAVLVTGSAELSVYHTPQNAIRTHNTKHKHPQGPKIASVPSSNAHALVEWGLQEASAPVMEPNLAYLARHKVTI